jgi:hypothetical protein
VAFRIEDLMTKVIPGGTGIWACPDDTQRVPRPCDHSRPPNCPDDTRPPHCEGRTVIECPDDTQQTGPGHKPRKASGLDLALLKRQLRERLDQGPEATL